MKKKQIDKFKLIELIVYSIGAVLCFIAFLKSINVFIHCENLLSVIKTGFISLFVLLTIGWTLSQIPDTLHWSWLYLSEEG